jgi:hypothetical protein
MKVNMQKTVKFCRSLSNRSLFHKVLHGLANQEPCFKNRVFLANEESSSSHLVVTQPIIVL